MRGHNGSIAVSSAEGKGSTFTVLLPALLMETSASETAPGLAAQPVARSHGRSVLVIDDEDIVRITAYVLQVNGAKPGIKPLTRETAAAVNSVLE